jgi:hypothetical protein
MSLVHSGQEAVIPTEQTDKPVLASDETWPDTVLAKTIYAHFADFEGLNPEEAADSTGALLYSLQQIGVVGSMPEPGNGVRVADAATLPLGDLTADEVREWFPDEREGDGDEWFHDSDMGAR